MPCLENCSCVLCRELNNVSYSVREVEDKNFILLSPNSSKIVNDYEKTRNLHAQLISEINSKCSVIQQEFVKNKPDSSDLKYCDNVHKSVVYISGSMRCDKIKQDITLYENIDDSTILTFFDENTDDKNVINVVFKNSFENANQIINDINCASAFCDFSSEDDFPLGMEADLLCRGR